MRIATDYTLKAATDLLAGSIFAFAHGGAAACLGLRADLKGNAIWILLHDARRAEKDIPSVEGQTIFVNAKCVAFDNAILELSTKLSDFKFQRQIVRYGAVAITTAGKKLLTVSASGGATAFVNLETGEFLPHLMDDLEVQIMRWRIALQVGERRIETVCSFPFQ